MKPSADEVLRELTGHEHRAQIAARVAAVLLPAAEQRRVDWATGETLAELGELPPLNSAQAETPFGNVLSVLDTGAQQLGEWMLLGCALASAAAEQVSAEETPFEARMQLLHQLCWLAAKTPCNAFIFVDQCSQERGRPQLWESLAALWEAELPLEERRALLLGLNHATSAEADAHLLEYAEGQQDPLLQSTLSARLSSPVLEGELEPRRRGRVLTVIQALSGWMFLRGTWRLFARYVLGLRRRGKLTISARGIELEHQLSMLIPPLLHRQAAACLRQPLPTQQSPASAPCPKDSLSARSP